MIELSVRKILLLYLRQHFSVTSFQNEEQRLSYMYKFLFCCLYPLQPTLNAFNNEIEKIIQLSLLRWSRSVMEAFLNYHYDTNLKRMFFGYYNEYESTYLGTEEDNTAPFLYLGTEEDNTEPFAYIGSEDDTPLQQSFLYLSIPASLYSNEIILNKIKADVYSVKPYSIYVTFISQ